MSRDRVAGIVAVVIVAVLVGTAVIAVTDDDTDQRAGMLAECSSVVGDATQSVARLWNEATLDAIRRDFPAPTVHSRNLFHSSAAMWDAWAAYDPIATGYFVDEHHEADDVAAARVQAISFAAFRILTARYADSTGSDVTIPEFEDLFAALCFDSAFTSTEGDEPAALGNRIAATVLDYGRDDGANELGGYSDPDYQPVNEPLEVAEPGTAMVDPNHWQPLKLAQQVTQNGLPLPDKVQSFVGSRWGQVTPFALRPRPGEAVYDDPGDPPYLGDPETDAEFKESAVQLIRFSGELGAGDGVRIDIGPGAHGNNTLGTNDGTGRPVNPVTGEPYEPNVVPRADFARSIAEFWADGPASETPPGHWNTVANKVADDPSFERRIGGSGETVDRLEWDVKLYFALNGAVHDAAIASWGAKSYYDYVRPISMIRYMGGLGQSSDPDGPSYHPAGLPLEPGLVEVIDESSSAAGGPHEHLSDHIGEIAIMAWRGTPDSPDERSGTGWILATEWVPYQKPTFVTPAFAGFVSGHSTFSRAAAEVLTAMTGSEYFPGGIGEFEIPAGSLEFEAGPDEDVVLQWATYYDAADEAGISRLYGGIHVRADDFAGRIMGSRCGIDAWELAQDYFDGTV